MAFLDDEKIGKRLAESRGKVSRRKYAMDAKVDPSQYAKIEKGELSITENILDKLVSHYGLGKSYILYGMKVPQQEEPEINEARKMEALFKLIDNESTLVDSNARLVRMLEKEHHTTNFDKFGIPEAFAPKWNNLLGVTVKLGVGKLWKNEKEGRAVLNKTIYADPEDVLKEGTLTGEGKKSN